MVGGTKVLCRADGTRSASTPARHAAVPISCVRGTRAAEHIELPIAESVGGFEFALGEHVGIGQVNDMR